MYGLVQAYGLVSSGLSKRALVVGADVLSKLMNFADRSTCVLFGDGAGAAVLERVESGGFLAFELGADGAGGVDLTLPAGGSRIPTTAESVARGDHYVHMNGRQVYKFATRVLVSSAEQVLEQAGLSIDDVDVYVPHQANVRIIDHAVARLGIAEDRVVVNVDRYGNTSSASIPLALADALAEGRVHKGDTVLMTGMGAGLTWGSAVMNWTEE
jgi:3-oxoacyl-[acyl-carrier-protein] synthase-3